MHSMSIVPLGQEKKTKIKKNQSLIIVEANFFVEKNGLLMSLKVEYFQCHTSDLVLVIILKKL